MSHNVMMLYLAQGKAYRVESKSPYLVRPRVQVVISRRVSSFGIETTRPLTRSSVCARLALGCSLGAPASLASSPPPRDSALGAPRVAPRPCMEGKPYRGSRGGAKSRNKKFYERQDYVRRLLRELAARWGQDYNLPRIEYDTEDPTVTSIEEVDWELVQSLDTLVVHVLRAQFLASRGCWTSWSSASTGNRDLLPATVLHLLDPGRLLGLPVVRQIRGVNTRGLDATILHWQQG